MKRHGDTGNIQELVQEAGQGLLSVSDPTPRTGMSVGSPRSSQLQEPTRGYRGRKPKRYAVHLKKVYGSPEPSDGLRILVDRLWPRGLRKAGAGIDLWVRDVAPSNELRRWFGHDVSRWREFKRRYRAELHAKPAQLLLLKEELGRGNITLLFAAHDELHNNAVVLKEVLEQQ